MTQGQEQVMGPAEYITAPTPDLGQVLCFFSLYGLFYPHSVGGCFLCMAVQRIWENHNRSDGIKEAHAGESDPC